MRLLATVAMVLALLLAPDVSVAQSVIEALGPSGPLKGILQSAGTTNAPVILIIPGSGPTDRDGNSPLGVKASTYRLMAEGLAERGISSVRVDKRGMFSSIAAVADPNAVTIGDYATDVANWITAIRSRTGERCVWLLGHSEGGIVVLAAAQNTNDVCGLLLVASPGRPMGEILRAQLKANPAYTSMLGQALSAIDDLEAGRSVDTAAMNPALLPLFHPRVQRFLIDALTFDPARLLRDYKGPVLIVRGERDLQVDRIDAELLHGARPGSKLVLLPNTNHVLKFVGSTDRLANLATYADPTIPLAPGLIETLVQFVKTNGSSVR